MATRNDVTVEYNASPRIAEVASPSVEMVMQDYVDTLRKHEDSFQGMGFKKLLNASGKEELGGGTKVGITVASQNLLLAFAGRTTPAQTGTVTGSPASPIAGRQIIQDAAATFITNNVKRGSLVINFTDNSVADVISVDSETQLTTKTLINGIGNIFTIADVYHVFNIIQVSAVGGNLTAVDGSQLPISPILPTAFTQVLITASSSATTQNQLALEHSTFANVITVDLLSSYAGTQYPNGTGLQPVNNFKDAKLIADIRGIRTFLISGDALLDDGTIDFSAGYKFESRSAANDILTVASAAIVDNCQFYTMIVTGTLDSNSSIRNAVVRDITFFQGFCDYCLLQGTIVLGGGFNGSFINCFDHSIVTTPIIDMGGTGNYLTMTGFEGAIDIINCSDPAITSFISGSGKVGFDATITEGTFIIFGDMRIVDNSGVNANIIDRTTNGTLNLIKQILINKKYTDPITGKTTIFADDDATALFIGNLFEDIAGTQQYRAQGADRQDRLIQQ